MAKKKKGSTIKVRRSITLSPINDTWLEEQAFEKSVPGDPASVSEIIDRLVDQARRESETPLSKKNAQAAELALAA